MYEDAWVAGHKSYISSYTAPTVQVYIEVIIGQEYYHAACPIQLLITQKHLTMIIYQKV